jgi:hypothetical protein
VHENTFLVRATAQWLVRSTDLPTIRRRCRLWRLSTSPVKLPNADILDVSVQFAQRIPIRLTTLIATGSQLSRAEVRKHIAAGRITSERRLTGRCAQDFGFVFRWRSAAGTADRDEIHGAPRLPTRQRHDRRRKVPPWTRSSPSVHRHRRRIP